MVLFSTIRSNDRSLSRRDRSIEDPRSPRAAHPTAPSMHRAGLTAASPSEVFAAMPVDLAVPDGLARPPDGVARPLRARRSQDVIVDHGRRK